MAEYIKREDAYCAAGLIALSSVDRKITCGEVQKIMNSIPNADVVEVVQCKDCIYYKTPHCTMDIWHTDVTLYRAKENDYCSYGRKG